MPPKPKAKPPPSGRLGSGVPRRTLLLAGGGAIVVAAVAIAISLAFSGGGKKATTPTTTVDTDTSAVAGLPQNGLVLGSPLAKVTLTEYIDTSCPICQDYVLNTFPSIAQNYVRSGKVKIEARLLAFVGPSSSFGRTLMLAAAKQNRAWQLAELLYHNQGDETTAWLTDGLARTLAAKVPGLDVGQLFTDAQSSAVTQEAAQMDAEAQSDGVRGTPTFVLTTPDGTRHLLGAGNPGYGAFESTFQKALAG